MFTNFHLNSFIYQFQQSTLGHENLVELLIKNENGIDVNQVSDDNSTALADAFIKGDFNFLDLFF